MLLLTIRHKDFTLTIESEKYLEIRGKALRNMGDEAKLMSYYRWSGEVDSADINGVSISNNDRAKAIFFDNADYPVWVDFNDEVSDAEFFNKDRSIAENCHFHREKRVLSGFVNYGNEIGRSELNLKYTDHQGVHFFTLYYEVLSTKLDYHEHWQTIVQDVEAEYNMLALDFLKKTYHGFTTDTSAPQQDLIWWNVFSQVQERFLRACRMIIDRPHNRLKPINEYLKADRIKRLTPQLENQVANHRKEADRLYLVSEYQLNNNTPENQFLKYAVKSIYQRYSSLFSKIKSSYGIPKSKRDELENVESDLRYFVNHPFFRNVSAFKGLSQVSLVLQNGSGYRDVYQSWIILRQGYSLNDGLYKLETKDIATLYEIWCFIQVIKIVREITSENPQQNCRTEMNKIFSHELTTGEKGRVLFEQNGIELVYNPKHDQEENDTISMEHLVSKTVPQKPDIVLQLSKRIRNSDLKFTYLFDAKYRIDKRERSGVDIPPADAINQMHRYRDAIYFEGKESAEGLLKKEIIGGYILFPGNGDSLKVQETNFYKAIDEINIGAFPLRPNDTENRKLLVDFIKGLIENDGANLLLQKNVIPQKGLSYNFPQGVLTLYGITGNLSWVMANHLYPIPLEIFNKQAVNLMECNTLVVFDSKQAFEYKITKKGTMILSKNELAGKGYANPRHNFYFMVHLDERSNPVAYDYAKVSALNLQSGVLVK